LRLIEKRVGLLFAAFALAFCVVMVRAAWLQTVKGGEYSADARSQQVATVEVPGMRGSILDRRGNALAVSEEAATIFATPYQVEDPPKTARKLADILGEPKGPILESLTAPSGFEYVAQKVDLVTADRIEKLGLAGIGVLPDSRRVYPQEKDGGRLIGAIGDEARLGYGVIGRVTNLAARLSTEAQPGQVLVSGPVHALIEDLVEVEPVEQVHVG